MKLIFSIDYRTNWGESLYIIGDIPELGGNDIEQAVKLHTDGTSRWSISVEITPAQGDFSYRYFVKHDDGTIRNEWGEPHRLDLDPKVIRAEIYDSWQDQPSDKPYYSSAFTKCICRRMNRNAHRSIKPGRLVINVDAPMILPGQVLAVSGSNEALGAWDLNKAVVLSDASFPTWTLELPMTTVDIPFDYKFLILDEATHRLVAWEDSDNHTFGVWPESANDVVVLSGLKFRAAQPLWRGAGVAIPVFSLRSEKDFGVGDFMDLIPLIDWAVATGQKFVQILPINDTTMTHTWTDSYPYNANSTFALHPMYLRLQDMGELADKHLQSKFDALGKELNQLPEVDYERVNNAKNEFTRALYNQQGASELTSTEFKNFFAKNETWLKPYAAYCVLRDRYNSANPADWKEHSTYDAEAIEKFIKENENDVNYFYYIQYHLDKQLSRVCRYGREHGVAIKGDIPIGISRTSVDAWLWPELFNLDCSAGAPPDDFSVLGQNWGFPTYNWDVMARDGFAWWKARFRKMAEYFDAYRIDHVLGFFRIWQIPSDAIHGLLGAFNPALPFTPEDLRYNYDFWLDADLHTKPFIMDYMLGDFFGEYADEVRKAFLVDAGYGRYHLRPEFDTQVKVARFFESQPKDEKSNRICNGLFGLIDDVLFIEDPYEKGKFHPRISAQFTYIYRSLTDYERWCFDRLYNDFFYHRHNEFWKGKALWKLPPLIDATGMLVCAEDLGMIPDCVPDVMHRLEILSLEIQRMPKDPAQEFGDTWRYPYFSVCTTSTHDMGGIRQWWEENPEKTQHYFNNVLHEGGNAPYFAEPWICRKIVGNHLASPSMLCILPLQDWLSIDGKIRRQDPREEQINVPANSRHYWRYRMHLTIEALQQSEEFNNEVRNLIGRNGR